MVADLSFNKITEVFAFGRNSMKSLQIARWAEVNDFGSLIVNDAKRPLPMANSQGTGESLLSFNGFGADIIRFAAGQGVNTHTHEGDHILFVLSGNGKVIYYGENYPLRPGIAYFVPGDVPHAVWAEDDNLVLIAVGNKHQPVDSVKRMKPCFKSEASKSKDP